jgi:16S rRNA (uracil1498-N3)-methyltransferase
MKVNRVLYSKHTFALFHPQLQSAKTKYIYNENMMILSSSHNTDEDAIVKRLQKVLRSKRGDEVIFFTNASSLNANSNVELPIVSKRYEIVEFTRNACMMRNVDASYENTMYKQQSKLHVTMCLGMLSKREPWEEQLYACAQAGIHHIQPIRSSSTHQADSSIHKNYTNEDRIQKVIIAAIEQSKQLIRFPIINSPKTIQQLAQNNALQSYQYKYYFSANGSTRFIDMLNELNEGSGSVLIMIGPEQDWQPDEIEMLEKNGFQAVTMGNSSIFRSQDCLQVVAGTIASINNT